MVLSGILKIEEEEEDASVDQTRFAESGVEHCDVVSSVLVGNVPTKNAATPASFWARSKLFVGT